MDRGDYSRYFKEVRASNTPSSRDSIEFELKDALKIDGVEENEREERRKREVKEWRSLKRPEGRETRLLESR